MKIRDKELWKKCIDNNQDGYGKAINEFAERWADVMESKMANGDTLEGIAEYCGHEADTDGITGFMYGAAVSTLAGVWEYGKQLRKWYNIKTQIGTEGEKANEEGKVLNPALLNISC